MQVGLYFVSFGKGIHEITIKRSGKFNDVCPVCMYNIQKSLNGNSKNVRSKEYLIKVE